MSNATALVTGATGFIGHHLCRRLKAMGVSVAGVSRSHAVSEDADSWLVCDLSDPVKVTQIVSDVKPDYIFHLASHVVGSRDINVVMPTFMDNLFSTVNLLVAAKECQCSKVVLTGSLEEPQPDQGWPVPSSPYAAAKHAASAYGRMFYSLYDLPVTMLRLFMVYGPEQRDIKKLIPYTIQSLNKGAAPDLSNGDRQVDWIYVDDVIDAFIACIDSPQANGETIDIGTGELTTIRKVVESIATLMKSPVAPNFGRVAARKDEQIRKANLVAAKQFLGWSPKTSLDEGLAATISSIVE